METIKIKVLIEASTCNYIFCEITSKIAFAISFFDANATGRTSPQPSTIKTSLLSDPK